jgi:hypothetical protein
MADTVGDQEVKVWLHYVLFIRLNPVLLIIKGKSKTKKDKKPTKNFRKKVKYCHPCSHTFAVMPSCGPGGPARRMSTKF